jgi:Xaa-Pro aminopeptidase
MSFNSSKPLISKLLYSESEHAADMFYFTHFAAPDPFIAFSKETTTYIVLNALEYSRGVKEAKVDHVLALEPIVESIKKQRPRSVIKPADIIAWIAKQYAISTFQVPTYFPIGVAEQLKAYNLELHIKEESFLPERVLKDKAAAKHIRQANAIAQQGFATAEYILRNTQIKNQSLYFDRTLLTSEILQTEIEIACLKAGGHALKPIVAGGLQACDPHCRGYGPLKANELIIIDIFPCSKITRYYGDMSRTFLVGQASEAQKNLVHTVLEAQQLAFKALKPLVACTSIHKTVQDFFKSKGYKTHCTQGVYEGFFHSTGHGLGLDLHESPGISLNSKTHLQAGMVVTIEPGLYYPGIGGARIEDVALITDEGHELLSNYSYNWLLI